MAGGSVAVKKWRRETKHRIVQAMGGCCQICGYHESEESLVCHHVDAKTKEFSLGSVRGNSRSWGKIVCELRKCVLLCLNCHQELHAGLKQLPVQYAVFDESFAEYRSLPSMDKCPICGTLKVSSQKTCSLSCGAKLAWSIRKSF